MKNLVVVTLVNALTGALLGGLLLGLAGLLLVGGEGFVNGLVWGIVFGVVLGASIGAYTGEVFFWKGVVERFGRKTNM